MKLATALKLGRISNLPTVWTNVLTGLAFSAGAFSTGASSSGVYASYELISLTTNWQLALLAASAVSLLYLAGMFLNDVFDEAWDREHQIKRPIVMGEVSAREVTFYAVALIILAFLLLFLVLRFLVPANMLFGLGNAAVLLALILLYDWQHKRWAFSPWIMGACRLFVYLSAGALVSVWYSNFALILAGLCLMAYIAGITMLARTEHLNSGRGVNALSGTIAKSGPLLLLFLPALFALYLGYDKPLCLLMVVATFCWLMMSVKQASSAKPGCVPKAIGALLAGICLIDSSLLFALSQNISGFVAILAFILCLRLQRNIAAS